MDERETFCHLALFMNSLIGLRPDQEKFKIDIKAFGGIASDLAVRGNPFALKFMAFSPERVFISGMAHMCELGFLKRVMDRGFCFVPQLITGAGVAELEPPLGSAAREMAQAYLDRIETPV